VLSSFMAPVSGRSIPASFGANKDAAGKFKKTR
jgi:hypothetical protein